jgi:hypothetical protein
MVSGRPLWAGPLHHVVSEPIVGHAAITVANSSFVVKIDARPADDADAVGRVS